MSYTEEYEISPSVTHCSSRMTCTVSVVNLYTCARTCKLSWLNFKISSLKFIYLPRGFDNDILRIIHNFLKIYCVKNSLSATAPKIHSSQTLDKLVHRSAGSSTRPGACASVCDLNSRLLGQGWVDSPWFYYFTFTTTVHTHPCRGRVQHTAYSLPLGQLVQRTINLEKICCESF